MWENFLSRKFWWEESGIAKFYPAINKFFTFFRANYTHKRGVKCTVDHRVMKIYRNNGPRNQKTILYFSIYLYSIIIFHIIITFTLRTFFVFLVVQVKKFLISFNWLSSLVIRFSGTDLRFLGTTCAGSASWSFFWNEPSISSPSGGSK